jgi:hypothetical protein
MNDYYDYLDKKTATNPDIRRSLPKAAKLPEPRESLEQSGSDVHSMTVEESTATDTIIERVKAYWRK